MSDEELTIKTILSCIDVMRAYNDTFKFLETQRKKLLQIMYYLYKIEAGNHYSNLLNN